MQTGTLSALAGLSRTLFSLQCPARATVKLSLERGTPPAGVTVRSVTTAGVYLNTILVVLVRTSLALGGASAMPAGQATTAAATSLSMMAPGCHTHTKEGRKLTAVTTLAGASGSCTARPPVCQWHWQWAPTISLRLRLRLRPLAPTLSHTKARFKLRSESGGGVTVGLRRPGRRRALRLRHGPGPPAWATRSPWCRAGATGRLRWHWYCHWQRRRPARPSRRRHLGRRRCQWRSRT